MNETEKKAHDIGTKLAHLTDEERLVGVAATIAGQPANLRWEADKAGFAAHLEAGEHRWALACDQGGAYTKKNVIVAMTVSLVHEAAGCTCAGPGPCPAFRAFGHAVEGLYAA